MHSVKLTSGRFKTCYQTSERTKSCICAIFTGNGGNNPPQPATVQEERKGSEFNEPALYSHWGLCQIPCVAVLGRAFIFMSLH